MTIEFNHTIIPAHDPELSARFLAEILGLPDPTRFGPFMVVTTDNGVSLDFTKSNKLIESRHYAFLITEQAFDAVFKRICDKQIPYWADHKKNYPGEINHNDGGRGFYFSDPNGHFLEVLTQPYGSDAL